MTIANTVQVCIDEEASTRFAQLLADFMARQR